MKRTAKILSILVALILILAPVAGMGEAAQPEDELVVGSTTALTGEFYLSLWGENMADRDVRHLIHGYNTVVGLEKAERYLNTDILSDAAVTNDKAGNKVYTFTLKKGLTFSDGKQVTAKDYVLTLLMTYQPLLRELGATVKPMRAIVGGESFQEGKSETLEGVRLIDDRSFSIALNRYALPDYNELRYVDLFPTPLHAVFPELDIVDTGKGVKISEPLSMELLKDRLNGENSYRSHPEVVSGPYKLASFDGATAQFVRNENYVGAQPHIEKIRFVHVSNNNIAGSLQSGEVDLITKISSAAVLNQLKDAEGLLSTSYPRQGMAYLAFNFEQEAVQNSNVRKAIAHSIDREMIIRDFLGGNGVAVNGYYGIGQWMAQNYQKAGKDILKGYAFDLKKAAELFKDAGYNAKNPLKLTLMIAENNIIAEAVSENLNASLKELGHELIIQRKPWKEVLQTYYRQGEQDFDMVFMASNFNPYFDPALQFSGDEELIGALNFTGIQSDMLQKASKAMRATPSQKPDAYYSRWIEFQQQFLKVLPLIPLYSNNYTDVYNEKLIGYEAAKYISWAQAIVNANFAK
ncbi:MAG: ABC transporter substrate-binding protein [Christensenellales bacterium]